MGQRAFALLLLVLLRFSISTSQNLSGSQVASLFHLRRTLEYPPSMSGWRSSTNLCALPSSLSLDITCSGNRVTELSISGPGNRLSDNFSIDALFTTLSKFSNLTSLSLTSLGLWGPIPDQVTSFLSLQTLNLSSNYISGTIPPSAFSLLSLRHLNLSRNLLTGELPLSISCSQSLSTVDLSNNKIVGSLPPCMSSNNSAVEVLASGNCLSSQKWKSECPQSAIAAVIPAALTGDDEKKKNHKLEFALAIAGGAAAGALVVALILVLKRTRRCPKEKLTPPVRASLRLPTDERSTPLTGGSGTAPRAFTFEEIEEATDGFSAANLIVGNSLRQVYRGKVQDGSTVVVAKMKLDQKSSSGQWILQFIDLISRLRHPNLCSIIGYCIVDSMFLIMEQPSNGTLRSHLTEWRKLQVFKWPQRVAAAIGVARGARFLHTVTVPGISDNKLTSENILVDQALTVKIANYNLPAHSNNGKSNRGKGVSESPLSFLVDSSDTRNQSMEDGEKEDIYQIGLILIELITGKPAAGKEKLSALKSRLEKALEEDGGSSLNEVADPTIIGTFSVDSMKMAAELALSCMSDDLSSRPPIDDVLWKLQYAVQVQDQSSGEPVS